MVSAVVHILAGYSDGGSRLFVQVVSIDPDYRSAQLMILVTDTWNGYSRRLSCHLSFGEIQTKIAQNQEMKQLSCHQVKNGLSAIIFYLCQKLLLNWFVNRIVAA